MLVERILSIGFVAFGLFFFIMSLQLESRPNVEVNPGSWPLFLTAMMIILGAVLIMRSFKKPPATTNLVNQDAELGEETVEDILAEDEIVYPRNFLYLFLTLAIYIACLGYFGFILSTLIVLVVATGLFGMRTWKRRIVTSVLGTAGFILLFPILLQAPFPRGEGIFRTFSLLFY